jgi:GNAT superfamily N-acetyltransferase
MQLDIKALSAFSQNDEAEFQSLRQAAYPPELLRERPGRHYRWATREASVLVRDDAGTLQSHAGILIRRGATLDGAPKTIGGICNVFTRPEAEGRGYASAAVSRALQTMIADERVDFCFLFCRSHMIPFYVARGWSVFAGRVLVAQPSLANGVLEPTIFNLAGPMVYTAAPQETTPTDGDLDLAGLPW